MNALSSGALVALVALATACGGSSSSSSSAQPPTTGGSFTITGGERLSWAETGSGADGFVYAAYVDGERNELQAMCTASAPAVYACESPLPPMTNGTHTLQLSAAIRYGDALVEGPVSTSIVVDVTTSGTGRIVTGPAPELPAGLAGVEGAPGTAAPSSCGLTTSDSTHLIAWTSAGELQLIDVVSRAARPLIWSAETDATWRVAALASRLEGASRIVYAALTSRIGAEWHVRVLRYRELNRVLGERAVLTEGGLIDEPARATASFDPGGRVFVAFAWALSSSAPRPFVVAVNTSAAAPLDFDVRFMAQTPVAAAWDRDGRFWIVERTSGGYTIRADGGATSVAATDLAGIEPLTAPAAAPIALFAADGSGWFVNAADTGHLLRRQFLRGAEYPFDSVTLSGASVVVGCSLVPQLALTYGTVPDTWLK
jgi:hypothetical protein